MTEVEFNVFADYHQFVVRDSGGEWSDLPDRWTDDAVEAMFVQGAEYVAVGTYRDTKVPITIRVLASEPAGTPAGVDRMAHGSLPVPSGVLVISGVTDSELSGGRVAVPAGNYRLRVLFQGRDSVTEDGLSGNDRYLVELWPVSEYLVPT